MPVTTTFTYGRVQANTTPVQISNISANSISIKAAPANTGIIYIGDSSVTDTTGYPLSAGESLNIDLNSKGKLYVYGAAGNYVNYFTTD
jgi:hypothetical protein